MYRPILMLTALCFCASAVAAETQKQRWEYADGVLRVTASPRTPQQIAAFYIGRKFPPKMVELLSRQCFITFGIGNHSNQVIWLDQSNWQFTVEGEPLHPLDRSHWKTTWQDMGVPLSAQSTFRWTLLPERLDFRPNEREGGNVILPRTAKPIRLLARFTPEGDAAPIEVRFDDLRCAEDPK